MTYEEINEMMQEIELPFAYHHFAEGESPKPPFVIYLSPGEETFGADIWTNRSHAMWQFRFCLMYEPENAAISDGTQRNRRHYPRSK